MTTWHSLTSTQTASELTSDLASGLSTAEAQTRLAQYGANKLPEPQATSLWRIFFDQFKGVMTLLLVAAAGIAFVLGDELEGFSILVVLLLNALLGFVNEYRAEKSVQALKALTVPPTPMEWLVVVVASLAPALLVELYKLRAEKG